MFEGSDSWPGPHFPALRSGRPHAACPARDPRKGGGSARVPRPRRKPLGAASARAGGKAPREAGPQRPEKMEAAPGPVTGRAGQAEAEPASAPQAGQGRARGHSRGWAGRLPLSLRVVAVPVLGRRRLGLLARSPRRGSGARPLRCLPPAPAPSDGLPRRRLRGQMSALGLPRRPPHCCARSPGLRLQLQSRRRLCLRPAPGDSVSPRPRRSPFPDRARL